jgi:hypothetical protein
LVEHERRYGETVAQGNQSMKSLIQHLCSSAQDFFELAQQLIRPDSKAFFLAESHMRKEFAAELSAMAYLVFDSSNDNVTDGRDPDNARSRPHASVFVKWSTENRQHEESTLALYSLLLKNAQLKGPLRSMLERQQSQIRSLVERLEGAVRQR